MKGPLLTPELFKVAKGPDGRFLPGHYQNNHGAGGRPKDLSKLIAENTSDGKEIVATLLRIMRGEPMKDGGFRPRSADSLRAAEILLERGYGKALEQHVLQIQAGQLPTLPPNALAAALRQLTQPTLLEADTVVDGELVEPVATSVATPTPTDTENLLEPLRFFKEEDK